MNRFLTTVLILGGSASVLLRAANPGDEVIMLFNTRVPDSKGVAEHYAQLRLVPTNQIFGFDLSTNEDFSRAEFRDSLQKPLAKKLEQQKLWHIASHIIPAI